MGIWAKWVTRCDGCGKIVEKEIDLTPETADESYFDIWGPGFPKGWIQRPYDDVTDQHYLFFHSKECQYEWLEKQGRYKEVEECKQAIWVA